MVSLSEEVQGFGSDGLIRILLQDVLESMRGSEVGTSPVIELSHEEMHLSDPIMAFLEFLLSLAIIAASGKIFSHLLKCGDGFVYRFGITIDGLCHCHMNFSDPKGRIRSQ